MAERIYDRKEFLEKVALKEDTLDALLKAQVLRPRAVSTVRCPISTP